MKRIATLTITLILLLNLFNPCYGAVNKNLRAKFSVSDVTGTNFKEITINPYYINEDEEDKEKSYYIYLPSGYFVEGGSASYVADKDGIYLFTVYDGSYKKTFTYKIDNINEDVEKDKDSDNFYYDFKLMYDYEKKQIFFNLILDKQRTVTTPKGNEVTNEVNFYIEKLQNNIVHDFTITIDKKIHDFKIIKSGEFYLLISVSPVNYNDYSTIVEYYGYNFTNNQNYTAIPSKDIYDDNGNYKVLIKSDSSSHVFSFNITGIDYRRPTVSWGLSDNDTIDLEIEDDFELDYLIAYDGKYVDLKTSSAEYTNPEAIRYKGEYLFTVVDTKGNRTIEKITINDKDKSNPPRSKHAINLEVHDYKNTDDLFENIGVEYKKQDDKTRYYENILPAYMNGSAGKFNPDSPISRAEMVTIFCRLNDLPYDTGARLKSKFTDIDNHWARDYISMGSSKKYVSGYKDKTFKPDNNVTRAEFCQMLTKISAYKSFLNAIPASSNIEYTDINNHWAESEIIKIAGRNLLTSNTDSFYPDKPITRGEVVHALNMLYGYNPSYLELSFINSLYNKYYDFQDINKHKYYNDIIISLVGMYREKLK